MILLNLCIHAVYLCWCVYQNMNIATESMNYVQLIANIGNFISMHWGRATIAIAHYPTAVSTVSLEYWQICIYPRRVARWQNRGRSPAHDGQLRSWSHQQFYKTQFIKQFITLQILSKLESKYFDAKYTFCPNKKVKSAIYLFCHKLSSRQCNHFDVRCFEKILFAKPKSVITFSTVWFPPINCVKQTKVWQ